MSHQAQISRDNRTLFVFLLDQSYSMTDPMARSSNRKMDDLATAINGWLNNMCVRATGEEHEPKDWMDIVVLGYRTDEEAYPIIESALGGDLEGKEMCSLTEIGAHPLRIDESIQEYYDEDVGDMLERPVKVPIWVEPKAQGGTPMCSALYKAYEIVNGWIEADSKRMKSFPPVVIHITDGENQEEGNPNDYAESIKSLETDDGNVLLFNCHISDTDSDKVEFPSNGELLPSQYARDLFKMSSELPDSIIASANKDGELNLQTGARGMVFNADMASLIKFLDMGTRRDLR